MSGYRAQVRGAGGWVDGGLFTKQKNAEADAARLAERYGVEVRVLNLNGVDRWTEAR